MCLFRVCLPFRHRRVRGDNHLALDLFTRYIVESISFQIKQQEPQQLPLPFEQPLDDSRLQIARQRLAELDIRDGRLIEQILSEARMVNEFFSFCYKLKTGKMKASVNPGGLFLTVAGLRKAQASATKNS